MIFLSIFIYIPCKNTYQMSFFRSACWELRGVYTGKFKHDLRDFEIPLTC